MLPEWFDEAVKLYNEKHSFLQIGRILNVDRKKISRILRENGYSAQYSFKERNGVKREFKTWRKYSLNENFFETIDTEEKAYWLGFLYADGYVNSKKSSIEVSLQDKDSSHIEKFAKHIESESILTSHKKTMNGKTYHSKRITLNSEKLKSDLIKHGCFENKSSKLCFPSYEHIPKHLIHHFIRGYIDGDGCYYIKRNFSKNNSCGYTEYLVVEVAGTEHFLSGIIKELNLHENKIHDLHKGDQTFKRVSYGGVHAIEIAKKLYDGATIFLDRKYDKVKRFLPS